MHIFICAYVLYVYMCICIYINEYFALNSNLLDLLLCSFQTAFQCISNVHHLQTEAQIYQCSHPLNSLHYHYFREFGLTSMSSTLPVVGTTRTFTLSWPPSKIYKHCGCNDHNSVTLRNKILRILTQNGLIVSL